MMHIHTLHFLFKTFQTDVFVGDAVEDEEQ